MAGVGLPPQILAASRAELSAAVGDGLARAIKDTPQPSAQLGTTLEWLSAPSRFLITLADPDYPQQLLQIPDPPPLLYVCGRKEFLQRTAFAVVGSRNATPQGVANAEAFAQNLGENGFCIVSGLALGIDAAAHRGGLRASAGTIAVVGTGPRSNLSGTQQRASACDRAAGLLGFRVSAWHARARQQLPSSQPDH